MRKILFLISGIFLLNANADLADNILRLQQAYPEQIQSVSAAAITWRDGAKMPIEKTSPNKTVVEKITHPVLLDQIQDMHYVSGKPEKPPAADPGRIRYEPFFRKMYGNNEAEVRKHLVQIYWMPHVFGEKYPLLVTTVNGVDRELRAVSEELEKLPAKDFKYLDNPGGTFYWRYIANTQRLSGHSFGFAIDINVPLSNYWQFDLKKAGQAVSETAPLQYHNQIPWEIVAVFEKHGFIWGGKWLHYDTMHFEYRPELLPLK